jgi:hypothetical protein
MAANAYHFISHWRVRGTVAEVTGILSEPLDLPRWWPAVYLRVRELRPGEESRLGREVDPWTRGWLPYTLRWQFVVTDVRPDGFALRAGGDFDGHGIWTFVQDGAWVEISYDWQLIAEKPLLRRLSFLMKPFFAANHRWAMAKGEQSLRLELARRRAASKEAAASVPPAPPPPHSLPLLLGAAAWGGVAVVALLKRRNSRA